ncbi:hypothetical protein [Rhodococcus wratislaviensis]|uniref:hypothetical protein n=1 Tax=Rhodococcus wratislaviensis TaxID=44752 RepID=UPI00364C7398
MTTMKPQSARRAPRYGEGRAALLAAIEQECERLGAKIRYNTYAEAPDLLAENLDVVIIATGGIPKTEIVDRPGPT